MKREKIARVLFIVAFFIICAIPVVLMPLSKSDGSAENRELSEFPALKDDNGGVNLDFTSELDTYLSEHFAFRSELVTLNSLIKASLFHESSSDKVIVGSAGWLYYGETLDDYTGLDVMSAREVYAVAHNLELMREYAEKQGASFIFTVAPNKNSVCGDFMPSRYKKGATSSLDLISEALSETDVKYVDLKKMFSELDSSELWHKKDSHWNNRGAAAATDAIMNAAGVDHTDFSRVAYVAERSHEGDLQKMLFPKLDRPDINYTYDHEFAYKYKSRFKSVEDMTIKTEANGKEHSLLMFRDSFGNSMLPFMAESFGEAMFSRAIPYRLDLSSDYDIAVLEIVERNLRNLLKYPAVFEAPERNIEGEISSSPCSIRVEAKSEYDMVSISGHINLTLDTDSKIYVSTTRDASMGCFEATLTGENSFAAYLPSSDIFPSGTEIYVFFTLGGKTLVCDGSAEINY